MPGTAELQSLVTMEAMAAGLPIVAADAAALSHLVKPGVNGSLFRPGDVAICGRESPTSLMTRALGPRRAATAAA
jgi:glycosyltransferase involved in cell wall biosynthesis